MVNKDKYVQRFKELYERKTGKKISDLEALEYFEKLVVLTQTIYKPILKKYMDEVHCESCGEPIEFRHFKNSSGIEIYQETGLCQDCIDLNY